MRVPERVELWWERRQRSKGVAMPYAIGTFRADWERYPVLIRQYHPELNAGITLTQVPPAADVWLQWECEVGHRFVATPWEQRHRPGRQRRRSVWCPECLLGAAGRVRPARRKPARDLCTRSLASRFQVGDAFVSECAPSTASAAEALLRLRLRERLDLDLDTNAVRVGQPFFEHLEVWPDLVMPDLRVAIEYDTTGRHGLEHVGDREGVDRRKDLILRRAGWEVVRIRCGKLRPLGNFDLTASGAITNALVTRVIDRLEDIRGSLIVASYLR